MTLKIQSRYRKTDSKKTGGKTTRKSAKEYGREQLKVQHEADRVKGEEYVKVLNEGLKIKKEKVRQDALKKLRDAPDPLVDKELFIQDYHRTQEAHGRWVQGLLKKGVDLFSLTPTQSLGNPTNDFRERWGYPLSAEPGSHKRLLEMRALTDEYDAYARQDLKERKDRLEEREKTDEERRYRRYKRDMTEKRDSNTI
jgi:hypothetical protein